MNRLYVCVTALVLIAAPAAAQIAAETDGYNFSPPGARPNAMGRAFIGLADDATAAITNPAGLMSLTKPQVSVEFSHTDFPGIFTSSPSQSISSFPSFLSVSAPISDRVTIGYVQQTFTNFKVPETGDIVSATTYGGTLAFSATKELSLGATVSVDRQDATPASVALFGSAYPAYNRLGIILGARWNPSDEFSFGISTRYGHLATTAEPFAAPASLGAGIAVRPAPRLLAVLDVVGYRGLFSSVIPGLSNIVEVHGGGEYLVIPGSNQLFVRFGALGTVSNGVVQVPGLTENPQSAATGGFGITVGPQFQVDFSYASNKQLILSTAVRF